VPSPSFRGVDDPDTWSCLSGISAGFSPKDEIDVTRRAPELVGRAPTCIASGLPSRVP